MFFIDQETGDDFDFALMLQSDDDASPSDDLDDELFKEGLEDDEEDTI